MRGIRSVADRAADWIALDSPRLKKNIHSFTPMEAARMPADTTEKSTDSGRRIFSVDDLASSSPTSRISMDTASPARYSIRP